MLCTVILCSAVNTCAEGFRLRQANEGPQQVSAQPRFVVSVSNPLSDGNRHLLGRQGVSSGLLCCYLKPRSFPAFNNVLLYSSAQDYSGSCHSPAAWLLLIDSSFVFLGLSFLSVENH